MLLKQEGMLERARSLQDELSAFRRDFHMHPELGFQEHRTARIVAETLKGLGITVKTGVGRTGVVGILGSGSPVVGIRADMDALPIQEANAVPYASQNPGVMHACGHDSHTAMLLGVARLLSEMPDRPAGEVRFLFQPSEESWDEELKSGATRMIEDGALDGVDAVIGLHVDGQLDAGEIAVRTGYVSAAVDAFRATIFGQGCHGAYPHLGVDVFFILAQVINAIHGIRARRINPIHPAVISIGAIHGGETTNVIPGHVDIQGTIRSFDEATRRQLQDELEAALAVARAFGGDFELSVENGYPSLFNASEVVDEIRLAVEDYLGTEALVPAEPAMGAEDFSYMAQQAPGAMFSLGAGLPKRVMLHSPTFDLDESALPIGAAVLADTACRLLRKYAK
jgi:amidohydrolase